MVANGAVNVLSHPSLQGISSGTGISGSTAWHGAFRFRQYLTSVKPDADERQLEFKKNQYGPKAETVVVRYQQGLFLPGARDRLTGTGGAGPGRRRAVPCHARQARTARADRQRQRQREQLRPDELQQGDRNPQSQGRCGHGTPLHRRQTSNGELWTPVKSNAQDCPKGVTASPLRAPYLLPARSALRALPTPICKERASRQGASRRPGRQTLSRRDGTHSSCRDTSP
jgi:hypothetical protein